MRYSALISLAIFSLALGTGAAAQEMTIELEPGEGAELVAAHCGACHSLALVTQNRGDREHWTRLIRWMQAEHNLWDLGAAETDILNYLETHYGAPDLLPRRQPLKVQWREKTTDDS